MTNVEVPNANVIHYNVAHELRSLILTPAEIEDIWAVAWDFQQCGILTCVDSDEPL